MSKIAFILNDYCCPRPLDFNCLFSSSRGLSGTDLGIVRTASEFVKLGHDVSFFGNLTPNQPSTWENVKIYSLSSMPQIIDDNFDAILSWCDPNPLKQLTQSPVRLVAEQLNNFSWCKNGFDEFVDIWTSPSNHHMNYQKSFNLTNPDKWSVVPNGCDPHLYDPSKKVSGRVIFPSSNDRGLHWLLSIWSQVKEAVPEAHLRVFYNFDFGDTLTFEKHYKVWSPEIMELGNRGRYILHAMEKLKPLGVEHIGSVSRERMIQEMSEATCVAFPCSTVVYTEGFSVSTLEACASRSSPVITDQDALGDVYGGVVPMVESPVGKNLDKFRDLVIRSLKDENFRNEVNERCYKFACDHTWENIAKRYEQLIVKHPKFKKSNAS